MRRAARIAAVPVLVVLALVLALALLLGAPTGHRAAAQDAPPQRVIADMVIRTLPLEGEGHCIVLEAGHLTVTLQLVGDTPSRPVSFAFVGYRGSDPAATIGARPSLSTATFTAPLSGGLYCYTLQNETPVPPDAGLALITNLDQQVAMWMGLAPSR